MHEKVSINGLHSFVHSKKTLTGMIFLRVSFKQKNTFLYETYYQYRRRTFANVNDIWFRHIIRVIHKQIILFQSKETFISQTVSYALVWVYDKCTCTIKCFVTFVVNSNEFTHWDLQLSEIQHDRLSSGDIRG